jgi:hypothetical protein
VLVAVSDKFGIDSGRSIPLKGIWGYSGNSGSEGTSGKVFDKR